MLNRCPSCQASVLDDDAETCPFCGSPMDPAKAKDFKPATPAKSASKPASKAKSKTAPAAAASAETRRPAAKKSGGAPAKPAPGDEDDDPFAADASATAGAIALSRKPTAQRSHKIVCPMCDTVGFAPTAASGKDVRCSNSKCMVPVFTAPDFAAPKPVAIEPQSSGLGPLGTTFAIIGGLVICSAAVWWFVLREEVPPMPDLTGPVTPGATPPSEHDEEPAAPEPVDEEPPPPPAPSETLAAVSNRWSRITEDISQPQRQSLLRRYGAESYAIAGQVEAAREQVSRLQSLRSAVPSYSILPLVEVAWKQLATGDEAAARATFEESAALVERIPQQGFDPARVVIGWASAAARFGQSQKAHDLAQASRDDAAGERLLAMLAAARLFSDGDLSAEYPLRPVWPSDQPKTIAVGLDLLKRGDVDQAKSWADGVSAALTRSEMRAAWAEATAVDEQRTVEQRVAAINAAVASSSPAERALVQSRAAIRLVASGQTAQAETLFSAANDALGQLVLADPIEVASLEDLEGLDVPALDDLRLNAAALGEAAHAATQLGKTAEAVAFIQQGLDHLRSAAPTVALVAERRREYDAARPGLENRLRNEYRRTLEQLQIAATQRFELQVELLARAIEWNLGPELIADAKNRHQASDAATKEAWFSGNHGGRLLAAALLAGDQATETEIRGLGVTNTNVPGFEALTLTLEPMLAARPLDVDKMASTGREFQSISRNRLTRSDWLGHAIRTACRMTREHSVDAAYRFAMAHGDDFIREELLRYLSVCVAQGGQAHQVSTLLSKFRPMPADEAAALRGLTEGLVAIDAGRPAQSARPEPEAARR